jgi:hypothetical protein
MQDCAVKMKLVAPPLYVLTTQTLDKQKGIDTVMKGEHLDLDCLGFVPMVAGQRRVCVVQMQLNRHSFRAAHT